MHRRDLLSVAVAITALVTLSSCGPSSEEKAQAVAAFATVQKVLQHPRCANCHIPGDAPLQFDDSRPHSQGVVRGLAGFGGPGLPCSSCHGSSNPPASYGPHAPPGAPGWRLPPPDMKMVMIGLSAKALCETLKDKHQNGNRDLAALTRHIAEDALVLWGWQPGGERAPVPVAHAEFVAAFQTWAAADAPCPD